MMLLTRSLEPQGNLLRGMVIGNQVVSILLPVMLFVVLLRLPWKETLNLRAPPLARTGIALFAGFVLILAVNSLLPRLLAPPSTYTQKAGAIVGYGDVVGLLLTILTVSIVAPVADELFFRGLLLSAFRDRYGTVAAVLIVGVLTAAFHSLVPFKLVHSFVMSIVFACAVIWTGSVWTSIMLHALHNSLSLLGG